MALQFLRLFRRKRKKVDSVAVTANDGDENNCSSSNSGSGKQQMLLSEITSEAKPSSEARRDVRKPSGDMNSVSGVSMRPKSVVVHVDTALVGLEPQVELRKKPIQSGAVKAAISLVETLSESELNRGSCDVTPQKTSSTTAGDPEVPELFKVFARRSLKQKPGQQNQGTGGENKNVETASVAASVRQKKAESGFVRAFPLIR